LDIWAQRGASLSQRLIGTPFNILWGYAMKKITAPIRFAGSHLDQTRHVCAFFNSADEEYLQFTKQGFRCGHKPFHVVTPHPCTDDPQRLAATGIDALLWSRAENWRLAATQTSTFTYYLRFGSHDRRLWQVASGKAKEGFSSSSTQKLALG
jgi:hypothetical protein